MCFTRRWILASGRPVELPVRTVKAEGLMHKSPTDEASKDIVEPRSRRTLWLWLLVLRRPTNAASLLTIGVIVLMAAVGPFVLAGDPYKTDILNLLQPPSRDHWFGTDEIGRDLLTRIVHGARFTLYAGLAAVVIGSLFGTMLGLVAGYFGGWVDVVVMTLADVLLSFPYFLLVVVIVAVLGPSLTTAMIAVGIWTMPYYIRVIRANTLEIKVRSFVDAAIVTGESALSVLFHHILRNCASQLLVLSTTYLGQAILMAAALSFLGLGAQPPVPEWGAMTAVGREYIFQAPHVLYIPALFIFITALAFNFLGDALRDVFDPRSRGR